MRKVCGVPHFGADVASKDAFDRHRVPPPLFPKAVKCSKPVVAVNPKRQLQTLTKSRVLRKLSEKSNAEEDVLLCLEDSYTSKSADSDSGSDSNQSDQELTDPDEETEDILRCDVSADWVEPNEESAECCDADGDDETEDDSDSEDEARKTDARSEAVDADTAESSESSDDSDEEEAVSANADLLFDDASTDSYASAQFDALIWIAQHPRACLHVLVCEEKEEKAKG